MLDEYRLDITLELRGPILTKATQEGALGVDAAAARDENGEYYLPSTLVKGKLREAWTELEGHGKLGILISELLGENLTKPPEIETGKLNERRGALQLRDCKTKTQAADGGRRYRIRRDEETRCAATGAYIVSEVPWGPGQAVTFQGSADIVAKSTAEANRIGLLVEKGLYWAGSFGSGRTTGFGQVIGVRVVVAVRTQHITMTAAATTFPIQIEFDRPFCFSSKHPSDTLFESEEFVSGANLKGALAMRWARLVKGDVPGYVEIDEQFDPTRKELGKHFWAIRFGHALPASKTVQPIRPVAIPHSSVALHAKDGTEFFDLALTGKACLIRGEAPAYSMDWKGTRPEAMKEYFGWPNTLKKQLRVRTAMDSATRKSKDGNLFALETVVPNGHVWLAEVDLSEIPPNDLANARVQLLDLLGYGLRDLGKTKATASLTITPQPHAKKWDSSLQPIRGDLWVITLQSGALLCDPRRLNEASGAEELFEAYKDTWLGFCKDLELQHFYARQTLAGGFYLQKRFQVGKEYRPYLLTEPGSVFVFRERSAGVNQTIEEWVKHGLPHANWLMESCGVAAEAELWKRCPFVRQNGYGEIAVNLDTHSAHSPHKLTKGDYAEINALEN